MVKLSPTNPPTRDGQYSLAAWLERFQQPVLAITTAFLLATAVIWLTSGSIKTVWYAYEGLVQGAFLAPRGLSETLVAAVPYVFLGLGVAVAFKAGLFNIGVEGQFFIGALSAAWAGQAVADLPAVVHFPLVLLSGAAGGAVWAAAAGLLKARTGAHEVITTIMLNYVAFRLVELVVSGPLKDPGASAIQTSRVSPSAVLWILHEIPERLQDPGNAFGVSIFLGLMAAVLARRLAMTQRGKMARPHPIYRYLFYLGAGIATAAAAFMFLPYLLQPGGAVQWPFTDPYDRLHTGIILAVLAAAAVGWMLKRTTLGFEMRMYGANPEAARASGVNISRTIVAAMAVSGALAGLAGTVEVLGVSICRCLPLFFSSGYGFDSIAIALIAGSHPGGILLAAFLFGAMRNGADLMELQSGISKNVISLIQAFALLFVAAPAATRWISIKKPSPSKEMPPEAAPAEPGD